MKRLVIAALAIGALAACTKSNVQLEQPGEISFQPVAQKATKAAVDGTAYPTDAAYKFNVWAWWGEANAGTALASFNGDTPYIAEGTFEHRGSGSWGGSTPYYWPTKGSLVFAGYSPASAKVDGTTFGYDLASQKFSVTNYVQSNDISATKDLMWFDVTDESHDNNGTNGVPVVFKHALSWLTFEFVLGGDIPNHKWEVTGVTLQSVNTKGSFAATKSGEVVNAGTWTLSAEAADKKEMTVYTRTGEQKFITTTSTAYENVGNGVVVIPQECVKLYVQYNLTASTGKVIPQEVTLDLATGINGGTWLSGNHYIYTITFGANEILIAPTVTEWTVVNVDNIPVQ